jgi:hypothetical protein
MSSFLGLGGGIRSCHLVSQLTRVDHQKTALRYVEAPVRILYGHTTDDTLPMPTARRLLPGAAWFCK